MKVSSASLAPSGWPPAGGARASAIDGRAGALTLLLCSLWGLQQVSLKAVGDQASPMLMVALRSGIALLLLAAWMRWQRQPLSRRHWPAGALAGGLFALEYLLVALALARTQAAHVVVFLYSSPLFAALWLHLLQPAERLNRRAWVGIGTALVGMAVAFLGGGGAAPGGEGFGRALVGDALALLAGLAMGATTVTIRCSRLATAPASETLCYQLLAALLCLLPAAALTGQLHWQGGATVWAHLAFQGVVVSFASFLAWFWLLTRYPASQLGAFTFLTPLFGVLFGAVLLGEQLTHAFLAGSLLVLAGVVLVSRSRSGRA